MLARNFKSLHSVRDGRRDLYFEADARNMQ